jgi:two-component system, OmpR family, alkaline phosphatase synthesis response regulator PhoP
MTESNPALLRGGSGQGAPSNASNDGGNGTQSPSAMPPNNESFLPQSTVLIVDDNPQNVELLQAFLESLPVKIVTAGDGIDALRKVEEHHPDLILLDIMMPHMSGFQVCRRLKGDARTRDIQVLMVTALNELGDIEQATECGTDDFVSKPVNKFELLTRVKSLLRVRHLKSELERALTYLNEIEQDEELDPATVRYTCPRHPDLSMPEPGRCPRCGSPLVAQG